MAPKLQNKNFTYLSKWLYGIQADVLAVNQAVNSIIPGSGQNLVNIAAGMRERIDNASQNYEKRTADPYEMWGMAVDAIRFDTPEQELQLLNDEKRLAGEVRRLSQDARMNKYPNVKEYLSFSADLLDMSSKGIDTQRQWARCPGLRYFTDVPVDWAKHDEAHQHVQDMGGRDLENLLSGMHWKEYYDAARSYMNAKIALDNPAISVSDKKKQTALMRRSLKNIEKWADHCLLNETAQKEDRYFVNYELNIRGARGVNPVKNLVHDQLTALDLGWDPAYVEDYAKLKKFTELAGNSLEAFDKLNRPLLANMKERVRELSELSPEGRQFANTAEFVQYYQRVGDAMKGLYAELNRPEVSDELSELNMSGAFNQPYRGNNTLIGYMPEYLFNEGRGYEAEALMNNFCDRCDFAARGIRVENGDLVYRSAALDTRENDLNALKTYVTGLKTPAKQYVRDLDRLWNNSGVEDENTEDLKDSLRDSLEKLRDIKPGENSPENIGKLLRSITYDIDNLAEADQALVPQGLTEWLNGVKNQVYGYGIDRINQVKTIDDQLAEIKNSRNKHISETYVRNSNNIRRPGIDPLLENYADDIKKYWQMTPENKNNLKNAIKQAMEVPEEDVEEPNFEQEEKLAISRAIDNGWDPAHLLELPKLLNLMRANDDGLRYIGVFDNAIPELQRLRSLMTELSTLNPLKMNNDAINLVDNEDHWRVFENDDQFVEYSARTRAVLNEIVTESSKPETRSALNELIKMKRQAGVNGGFEDTIMHALIGRVPATISAQNLGDPDAVNFMDAFTMLNPEKDRFKGKPGVMDTIKKVTLQRERKNVTRIGLEAMGHFNEMESELDMQRQSNSDYYLAMKSALARVAGLQFGDHTPERVFENCNALYKAADKYEKERKGILKSDWGDMRLEKAAELKEFAQRAMKEYKAVIGTDLDAATPVDKQRQMNAAKKEYGYNNKDVDTIVAINGFKSMANDIWEGELADSARFFNIDAANRHTPVARRSDSYNALTDQTAKVAQMFQTLDDKNPVKVYIELKKTMEAAKRYVDDHTGLSNIHKANKGQGPLRVQAAKRIYERIRERLPKLNMAVEGLRSEGKTVTTQQLTQNYASAPAAGVQNNINDNVPVNDNAAHNVTVGDNNENVHNVTVGDNNENVHNVTAGGNDHIENNNNVTVGDDNQNHHNVTAGVPIHNNLNVTEGADHVDHHNVTAGNIPPFNKPGAGQGNDQPGAGGADNINVTDDEIIINDNNNINENDLNNIRNDNNIIIPENKGNNNSIGGDLDDMGEMGFEKEGKNNIVIDALLDDQEIEKIDMAENHDMKDGDFFGDDVNPLDNLFDPPAAGDVPGGKKQGEDAKDVKIDYKKEMEKYHEKKGDLKANPDQMQIGK